MINISVISRNALHPGLNRDYSILDLADSIKSVNNNGTFQYMLDAHSRRHWGGIFEAPTSYRLENRKENDDSYSKTKVITLFHPQFTRSVVKVN